MALIATPFPCNIASEKLQTLDHLVNAFLPIVAIPHTDLFGGIFVVPDELQVIFINELLRLKDEQATYIAGTQKELDNAYISELNTSREAPESIVEIMTEFFANIGIICCRTEQESWSISFNVYRRHEKSIEEE
jgi:hypothetical protein